MKKKFPWFEAILIVVFISIQIYAALADAYLFPNSWFNRDDAYYYFKVAQNISQGLGSTFDGIHLTNGYHPLWMLVCVPIFSLARFDLILPLRVLLIVMSVLNVATAILLYRLIRDAVSPAMGMFAALLWTFDLYVQGVFYNPGLESGIALFFIVLLLYLVQKFERTQRTIHLPLKQFAVLGLIAALMVLSRLDLIFFGIVIGLWIVFRKTPMRYLLPLDILVIVSSTLLAFISRLGVWGYYSASTSALIVIGLGTIIKIAAFYFFGLYQPPSSWTLRGLLKNTVIATAISGFALTVILLGGSALHILPVFSLVILATDALFTFMSLFAIRILAYIFRASATPAQPDSPINILKDHWKDWLKEGAVYYSVLGGILAAYMLWSKIIFGTSSPVSGQIKRWWGTFAISTYGGAANSILSFFAVNPTSDFNAWQYFTRALRDISNGILYKDINAVNSADWANNFLLVILIAFILLCGILFINKQKAVKGIVQTGMIPLLAGSWLQIYSYNMFGYAAMKAWYWLTEQVLIAIATALLIEILLKWITRRNPFTRIIRWILVIVFGIGTAYNYGYATYLQMPHGLIPPETPYADVVPFIEEHTQPGDIIGMTGGGNIGYFIHNRTIVNMDGLINSYDYFQALKNGSGSDYLYNTGMRFVFANPDIINALPYRGQYANRLKIIAQWGGKDLMRLLPKPNQ